VQGAPAHNSSVVVEQKQFLHGSMDGNYAYVLDVFGGVWGCFYSAVLHALSSAVRLGGVPISVIFGSQNLNTRSLL